MTILIRELLQGLGATIELSVAGIAVGGVVFRSDQVSKGDVFFCVPGFVNDGHDFAADAVARGASAIVCERHIPEAAGVPQIIVKDTRAALARAAAVFRRYPSHELDLVGITGTNGKTTTTYLLDSILRAAGHVTGLIGTVETRIAAERFDAGRTTPESADLQELLRSMRDAGVTAVSMEVSSHAIDLHRVDALRFAVAAFTNLTQDHLDYHHTIEEYFAVKRRLFTDFEVGSRVVNIDDLHGAAIAVEIDGVLTVGRASDAMIRAVDEELLPDSAMFTLSTPAGSASVHLPLAAEYNVSNALVAAGCGFALGIDVETIAEGLSSAPQVPGRLERIEAGQPFGVFVDYAHTPDSLEKAIGAVRDITPGRVLAVFGCGGDRDPDKRPLMGTAAAGAADHVIITSDNPRSENPVGIILQVEDGARAVGGSYEVIVDRRAAIAAAIDQAAPGDAVLIAGKGHEDYQIFADRTIHFDDREVATEEVARRC